MRKRKEERKREYKELEEKKKMLKRQIYVRNMNGIFNHKGPSKHIVEVELFYKGHKE